MTITVNRIGSVNDDTGSWAKDNALFLKVYGGEVLTAFARHNVTSDKHMVRTISSGRSAQFPVFGKATGGYHTPGTVVTPGKINGAERVITIDDVLLSNHIVPQIDEAKAHYDVRSVFSGEQGRFLAAQMDQHVLQMGVKAARVSAGNVTGAGATPGGTVVFQNSAGAPASADWLNNGDHLAKAIYMAAERLAANDIGQDMLDEVYAFVRPAQYYKLVQSDKVLNRDYSPEGNGSYARGRVLEVAGIKIIMTNNLPQSNITTGVAGGDSQQKYTGDFTNTAALVMHKSAVGTVKLMDLAMEMEYKMEYQGTWLLAKYAVGHDYLRPESAVEIRAENPI